MIAVAVDTAVRCSNPYCRKLLAERLMGFLQIKCPRCNTVNTIDTRGKRA